MHGEPLKSVLFLDNDPDVLSTISELLKRLRYRVASHTEEQETLAVFSEGPKQFNAVILNYMLNKTTGIEVARKIRAIRPDIPIILFTGLIFGDVREKALEEGINEYLSKPATLEELNLVLNRWCGTTTY